MLYAQSTPKINCLQPYTLEFSKDMKMSDKKFVRYDDHDDHTFWYKFRMNDNEQFSYSFKSLDEQDNYTLFFYQYDGNNFCRSLIQNNLEMVSFERDVALKVKKNENYYIGIYALFPGGCGHSLSFKYGDHELILESLDLHGDCAADKNQGEQELLENEAEMLVVTGEVLDEKTRNKINAGLVFIDPFTDHKVYSNSTEDGFIVRLRKDGDYKLMISSFGYEDKITALSAYEGELYSYELKSSDKTEYVLNEVYFYPNTYALKEESKPELKGVYSFLSNHKDLKVEIIGHTNGSKYVKAGRVVIQKGEEWNFSGSARELSLRRAMKIKSYLEKKGLDTRNIEAKGLGGDEMIVKNPVNMKEAMENIRVEIKIWSY